MSATQEMDVLRQPPSRYTMPKISIITTVYNAAATIRDCFESVQSQSCSNLEHIIIDGGSTDGTLDVIKTYKPRYDVKIVSEPDHGIYDGMNKGLNMASGDIVGILNADDIYADTDILATVAETLRDEPADACYGNLVYVRPENTDHVVRYWQAGSFSRRRFYWGWMPPHPTFFARRSTYTAHGFFNKDLGSAADYELMLRFLVVHKITAAYIPRILVKMRVGGASNSTLKSRLQANAMDRKAWKVNNLTPYPWTLHIKPLRKILQWFIKP